METIVLLLLTILRVLSIRCRLLIVHLILLLLLLCSEIRGWLIETLLRSTSVVGANHGTTALLLDEATVAVGETRFLLVIIPSTLPPVIGAGCASASSTTTAASPSASGTPKATIF